MKKLNRIGIVDLLELLAEGRLGFELALTVWAPELVDGSQFGLFCKILKFHGPVPNGV